MLRDYQTALLHNVYSEFHAGKKCVCAVMPTGAGKTRVKAKALDDWPRNSTAIAHRQELVSQISKACAEAGVYHRIIAPDNVIRACINLHLEEVGRNYVYAQAPVAVCGIDTLNARSDDSAIVQWCNSNGLWSLDEGHHLLKENKWGKGSKLFTNALGLGFTATPLRADRKSLHVNGTGLYDSLVVGPTMRELIERGYLTDYRYIAPKNSVPTDDLLISAATGDFNQDQLRKRAHQSQITGDTVQTYLQFARGKRAIYFAVDSELAIEAAKEFQAHGVTAEVVGHKTPDAIRRALIRKFRHGLIDVLVNVDLFGEGFDVPACEVVIMARPTQSYGLYVQQFGRALRPADGKTHGIVIDHVENWKRHGMPDRDRTWTLEAPERTRRRKVDDGIPMTNCNSCFFPYERIHKVCPHCGAVPVPVSRDGPAFVDGDMTEFSPQLLASLRGEQKRIDGSVQIPDGASDVVALAIKRRWKERQQAQTELRDSIAAWAGIGKYVHGYGDSELYKRFYWKFGVDVATACTLDAKEAGKLTALIREEMI